MILKNTMNEKFNCAAAVKGSDYIRLYSDEAMTQEIAFFGGISDFAGYTLEGGDWTAPPLTKEEELELAVAELGIIVGGLFNG